MIPEVMTLFYNIQGLYACIIETKIASGFFKGVVPSAFPVSRTSEFNYIYFPSLPI